MTVRGKGFFLKVGISQGIFDQSSKILNVDKFSGKSKNFILIQKFHADYKNIFIINSLGKATHFDAGTL